MSWILRVYVCWVSAFSFPSLLKQIWVYFSPLPSKIFGGVDKFDRGINSDLASAMLEMLDSERHSGLLDS